MTFDEKCDVIVVGAGHAGCEAALAAARLGMEVLLFSISLENVAQMPCNPSVGGPGKGHLVREIDALGGEMARCIDATALQVRLLNTSKGPAVQSLRAQVDRNLYHLRMLQTLSNQPRLRLNEATVADLVIEGGRVRGVINQLGRRYGAEAVILCMGPYLASRVHVGHRSFPAGPRGQREASDLGQTLRRLGLRLMRFKTGTSPRVHARSLDTSRLTLLEGEYPGYGFSFETRRLDRPPLPCWVTHTTARTHAIIRKHLHDSAMYSGAIQGPGPRYCPSIEAKLVMFPDKDRHLVFIEPEGVHTHEMYLAGLSTSLPEDIQIEFVRTVPGLERAEITRFGYAIEYDCLDPLELERSLQLKKVKGLFAAGQINGTTGYEEAAAQGLMAGINAVRYIRGEEPVILDRSQAYIGVLIDDLVSKGTAEPYRMMTSRAEYRLLLREDTADRRLTPLGHSLGLISPERFAAFEKKQRQIEAEKARLEAVRVPANEQTAAFLQAMGSTPLTQTTNLKELLRRPELNYETLAVLDPEREVLEEETVRVVENDLRYAGYIERQQRQVAAQRRMEERRLPEDIVYSEIGGLSLEAREKLDRVRPQTLGQAARISGVSPADIAVLLVHLESRRRQGRGRVE
ncbi:MAG: tRNA uridine-5-carboxymethylaminomethyl(34) synthesis enzyme MnmG [Firmicutes bacterium]|nr:tRNA uridine-5-carboxymethylaminomethyl(34) synthesis enzyme MnmG [Bacillota bacterium]